MKNKVEAILFVSDRPLTAKRIAQVLGIKPEEVVAFIQELSTEYDEMKRGFRILTVGEKYQLVSASEYADVVKKFLNADLTAELTKPSIETLAIIGYRGPVSKAELEMIRGVNCSLILRNLMMRGLVDAKEDSKTMQTYYSISGEFLRHLGVTSVEQLPHFEKLNADELLEKLLNSHNESDNV